MLPSCAMHRLYERPLRRAYTLIASYTKMTQDDVRSWQGRVATSLRAVDLQPIIDTAVRYHEIDRAFPAQELIFPGVP